MKVIKRNGSQEEFDILKIYKSVALAADSTNVEITEEQLKGLDLSALTGDVVSVDHIQDVLISALYKAGLSSVADSYMLYREGRRKEREVYNKLMEDISNISLASAKDVDLKRENANINGDVAMGQMLRIGSEAAKTFYCNYVLKPEYANAHLNGDIHIHDLDFYPMTTTCCQIDVGDLLTRGFDTGHGSIRPPKTIRTACNLACIAIQSNQNDQHGGQSIPNFDRMLAPFVDKTVRYYYKKHIADSIRDILHNPDETVKRYKELDDSIWDNIKYMETPDGISCREYYEKGTKEHEVQNKIFDMLDSLDYEYAFLYQEFVDNSATSSPTDAAMLVSDAQHRAYIAAIRDTKEETFQGMEALVHNLNTMQSRAGSQVPFSSINFGTDTSDAGRLVAKTLMQAQENGLGGGETPIFPILIYRLKDGINTKPNDINYDTFQQAIQCSAKRMFPNFSFQDAPYNLQYYDRSRPETEIAYMGCRTRVIGNVNDPSREITYARGNLSFTSINLPRLAIKYRQTHDVATTQKEIDEFKNDYVRPMMELCKNQLLERFKLQQSRVVNNFPFLMGQGVWLDSKNLHKADKLTEVLKHGTLSIGFIGLAETLKELLGVHHGESEKALKIGLDIIQYMRDFCDKAADEMKLNFSLLATPAEGLCFVQNTLVQTVQGNKPISRIKAGDYILSYNEDTHLMQTDRVVKAGKSGVKTALARITFDTGQQIICTPDHMFGVRKRHLDSRRRPCTVNGFGEYIEWRRASELLPGDRIKSCYIETRQGGRYYRNRTEERFLHKVVYEDVIGPIPPNYAVHHKDGNPANNHPDNLELLTDIEHRLLHHGNNIKKFQYKKQHESLWKGHKHDKEVMKRRTQTTRDNKKLSVIDDNEILEQYRSGVPVADLERKYDVNSRAMYIKIRNALKKEQQLAKEVNHVVVKVELFKAKRNVYDITTEKNHNFYVGGSKGILAHNSGRFVRMDKKRYGEIQGVTDKDWYTNSFHVPVEYNINAYQKIQKEAPFHALTNAGHISYIELDGDAAQNLTAMEKIIMCMKESGMGYAAINHPIDYDPECGFRGVIEGSECPKCGRTESKASPFERIRRITGYLVGGLDRFNNAKKAEEAHRVHHSNQEK